MTQLATPGPAAIMVRNGTWTQQFLPGIVDGEPGSLLPGAAVIIPCLWPSL